MTIKSKPAVVKIGQSKYFHETWENVQKAMTEILNEAHNSEGTMDGWVEAINGAKVRIDDLNILGWSVRHGHIKE